MQLLLSDKKKYILPICFEDLVWPDVARSMWERSLLVNGQPMFHTQISLRGPNFRHNFPFHGSPRRDESRGRVASSYLRGATRLEEYGVTVRRITVFSRTNFRFSRDATSSRPSNFSKTDRKSRWSSRRNSNIGALPELFLLALFQDCIENVIKASQK